MIVKIDNKQEKMEGQDNIIQIGLMIFLIVLLFANTVGFFFVKNSTRDLRLSLIRIDKDIMEENKKLSIIRSEFSKNYKLTQLKDFLKDRLNLDFSSINQIKDFVDII